MAVKIIANLLVTLGLPLGAAMALAVLLAEGGPLGLSELSEKTGYAKSHLSLYLKTLASRGLVRVERRGRRLYYSASINGLVEYIREHLEKISTSLSAASQSVKDINASRILSELSNELKKTVGRGDHG